MENISIWWRYHDIAFKVTSQCLIFFSQLYIFKCVWWHCFQGDLSVSYLPQLFIVTRVRWHCFEDDLRVSHISQLPIVTRVWWHCFQGNIRMSLSQLSIVTCVWWHCFQGDLRVSLSTVYCHMCLMTLFSRWPQGVSLNCLLSHVSDDIVFKVTSGRLSLNCLLPHVSGNIVFKVTSGRLSQLSIVTCVWWHCFQGDLRVSLSTVYCHMCLMTLFSRWPQGVSLNCLLSHVSDDIVFKVTSGCLSQLSIVTCVWWYCFQGDLRVSLSTVYCHMCLMTLFSRWPQGVSLNCLLSHVSDDIVFKVTSGHLSLSQLSIVTCVWWHYFQGNPIVSYLSWLSIVASMCLSVKKQLQWNLDISRFIFSWVFTIHPL